MSDVLQTHSTECWRWHHECAKRIITELRADIQRAENVLRSVKSERDYAVQQIGDLRAENERLRELETQVRALYNDAEIYNCNGLGLHAPLWAWNPVSDALEALDEAREEEGER